MREEQNTSDRDEVFQEIIWGNKARHDQKLEKV